MSKRFLPIALLMLSASPAWAHPGHGVGSSVWAGFAHPLTGLDHIAAMVAVGVWAALAGGKRLWLWPAAFVGAMILGAGLGQSGVPLPMVEPAIALSVIVLGALVALGLKPPYLIGSAVIALFGCFHGYAHGAESSGATFALYALGFAVATILLHGAGIGLGRLIAKAPAPLTARVAGLATVALGAVLLAK